jgi:alpha-beta hydrolase superfamily lysophospholipase
MTSTTSTHVTRDGVSLVVRTWEAPDPKGLVLLVHGISEHTSRYNHVAEAVTESGLSMVGFDLRGHGESGGPRIDIEAFSSFVGDVGEMMTLVRERGLPVVMYGHSLGGLISLSYVVEGKNLPDALILSAPALGAKLPPGLETVGRIIAKVAPTFRLPTSVKGAQLSSDPSVGEAYFADPLVVTKSTARMGVAVLDAMKDVQTRIDDLTIPTYVFHGADDSLVPTEVSEVLETNANVRRVVYEGMAHETHNEIGKERVIADLVTAANEFVAAAAT